MGKDDEGFTVVITKDDIKEALERKRLKEPVYSALMKGFEAEGFNVELVKDTIRVFVRALLAPKDVYSISELEERLMVYKEIGKGGSANV